MSWKLSRLKPKLLGYLLRSSGIYTRFTRGCSQRQRSVEFRCRSARLSERGRVNRSPVSQHRCQSLRPFNGRTSGLGRRATAVKTHLARKTDWGATYSGCDIYIYLHAFSIESARGYAGETGAPSADQATEVAKRILVAWADHGFRNTSGNFRRSTAEYCKADGRRFRPLPTRCRLREAWSIRSRLRIYCRESAL